MRHDRPAAGRHGLAQRIPGSLGSEGMAEMKACWIDHGQEAQPDLLRKHGITSPYFDPRPHDRFTVDAAYLERVKGWGFQPGLYFAWNWWPVLAGAAGGAAFAVTVDAELRRIGWLGNPAVCLDIEVHDPAYINQCLRRWRELRPTRQTFLTVEGMQGGWFEQCADTVKATRVTVAPQYFVGAMQPHPHSVDQDLLEAGVPGNQLVGFYDAARLPYRWRGFCLSQGRLP